MITKSKTDEKKTKSTFNLVINGISLKKHTHSHIILYTHLKRKCNVNNSVHVQIGLLTERNVNSHTYFGITLCIQKK